MSRDHATRQPRAAFSTLGCRLNQYETDSIATQFSEAGYEIVPFEDQADVYVLNSCTVTNRADRKSRNLFYRAQRSTQDRSDALVVLTGCYVDSHRDEIEQDRHTFVVPNEAKQSIFELADAHRRGEVHEPNGSVFDFPNADRIFHTRTTIKIQDGCDNFCTFCIIPQVRGRAQSRPADEVIEAVESAVECGSREIVLTGVNMSRYQDKAIDFADLVERVLTLDGSFRVRLSSLEPDQLTPRFIELFLHEKMVPHLHLCLQSASERILLAMRRQYTYEHYRTLVRQLRSLDPLFNVTTDLIVGFPGETEEEHRASLDSIREIGFGHVHVFPYSVRRGTRAERMPGRVHSKTKKRRAREVREVANESEERYYRSLVGTTQQILVERVEDGAKGATLNGLTAYYPSATFELPGVGASEAAGRHHNEFVPVEILAAGAASNNESPSLLAKPIASRADRSAS